MPERDDNSGTDTLTLNSDLAELERLKVFIDGFCTREKVPENTRYHLSVALDELVTNAILHGACEPSRGAIRLAIRIENGEVRITLCDTGIAFDPLQAPAPDLTLNVLSRPIGGLGIHLVRCLIPAIRYERRGERNYLYLTKPVEQGATHADRAGDHPR